jgi:hypothetical protein
VGDNLVPNETFLFIINIFDEIRKPLSSIFKRVIEENPLLHLSREKMNCAVFWRMIVIGRDYRGRGEELKVMLLFAHLVSSKRGTENHPKGNGDFL